VSDALARTDGAVVHIVDGATLTRTGLTITGDMPYERWEFLGQKLREFEGSVMWWIGDWLNYGESAYGEKYSQAIDATDYAYGTLRNAAFVSGRLELSRRRDNLSWSHHSEVASLEPAVQDALLDKAVQHGMSQKEFREFVRIYKRNKRKQTQPAELPAGVFSCIEADPPWALDASEAKSAIGQYTVMDLEAIKAMGPDVQARAADNAHLWLWAINPMLPEALDVMAAWGFDYKGCLTWVKTNGFGTGHYLRGATEHCLLGIRGTLACLRNDQRTYFEAPRTDHSRKPEVFYDILETLSPGPRMRLFARSQRDGWESWGDEA
jgi:N6-adenosine-specific RNA methylase IME4